MIKALLAALTVTLCCLALSARAITPQAAQAAAERMLGAERPSESMETRPSFTRRFNASGVVAGSFVDSVTAAGVPPAAMLEALQAFRSTLDLRHDVADGDRFWVRYERAFTLDGSPLGIGRVLWAELRSSKKGTISIHRFRNGKGQREPFWLASGQSTETSAMRMPLDQATISSGFGVRADPFDQPGGGGPAMAGAAALAGGPGGGPVGNVNVATPLGMAMGLSAGGLPARAVGGGRRGLVMHSGIDFVADPGTPVHAASDGVVVGAQPKGAYGNWIEIAHEGDLSTVYGHLSGYAPGMRAGLVVEQGQVIGYVGNTGRSTGAHLHFELLVDGRPVNPIGHATIQRGQLRGAELLQFRRLVAANLAEAEREGKPH